MWGVARPCRVFPWGNASEISQRCIDYGSVGGVKDCITMAAITVGTLCSMFNEAESKGGGVDFMVILITGARVLMVMDVVRRGHTHMLRQACRYGRDV